MNDELQEGDSRMIRVLLSPTPPGTFQVVKSILMLGLIGLACRPLRGNCDEPPRQEVTSETDQSREVWQYIELLKSPSFTKRQLARRRLNGMRDQAYDALLEAQNHTNTEIRLAAREILGEVEISWVTENDPDVISGIMKGFSDKSYHERKAIVAQLSRVEETWDSWVLIRIVRFDASESISKWAALAIMERCGSRADSPSWQNELLLRVQSSRRVAAGWLQLYPLLIQDMPSATRPFEALIESELNLATQKGQVESVDPQLTLALTRWYVQRKLTEQPQSRSDSLIDHMAWLIGNQEPAVKEHLDWLAMMRQWPAMKRWGVGHSQQIESWPETQFRLAEAYRQTGETETAQDHGLLGLQALPSGLEDRETIAHSLFAMNYPHWAIAVLQSNLNRLQPGTEMDWRMRIDLTLWLEDQCRWEEAAKTLSAAIEAADSDIEGWNSVPELETRRLLRSECLRLQALALIAENPEAAKPYRTLIDEALRLRPRDPNLLILKWNGLSESERRASNGLQRLIDIQVGQLQDRIRIIEQDLSRFPIPNVELQLKRELLTRCIALARLICETDGDAQLALQLSKKAQTLDANNPEVHIAMAMSLRAAGQIPAAVTAQQQAVALRPQSERIIRLGKDLEKIAARSSQSQETIR
jgi:tetratricopeptide (TPR) repeat protein